MTTLEEKFEALGAEYTPGQEVRQESENFDDIMVGTKFEGVAVDFSHGDVYAFTPIPGSEEAWKAGFDKGAEQAYTDSIRLNFSQDHLAAVAAAKRIVKVPNFIVNER